MNYRLTAQSKKRKAEATDSKKAGIPTAKFPRTEDRTYPEVIVIEDEDSSPNNLPKAVAHADQPRDNVNQDLSQIKKSMEDNQHAVVNIRDQVVDWSLRVQENEASISKALASIGDLSGQTWKEQMHQVAANEIIPLIRRIEKLESHQESRIRPSVESSSVSSTSKPEIKASTPGPTTCQSRTENKIPELSVDAKNQVPQDPSTTANAKISESERAGVQLDVLSNIGVSLESTYWRPPAFSNKGLERLLRQTDFRNTTHLKALKRLDAPETSRDCIMFSDCQFSAIYQVDYILRTGPTPTYLRCEQVETDNGRKVKLRNRGLTGLKILELKIPAPEGREDRRRFKEWKTSKAPPKYIYDLGQLFLCRHGKGRHELIGTKFNVVLDIAKPRKPVWLLLRPEYESIELKKHRDKDSQAPFPSREQGLNGVAVAKLAESIESLDFCHDALESASASKFPAADNIVASTFLKGRTALKFFTPDIDQVEARVMAGWKGAGS